MDKEIAQVVANNQEGGKESGRVEEWDFIINLGRLNHTGIGGMPFGVWLI